MSKQENKQADSTAYENDNIQITESENTPDSIDDPARNVNNSVIATGTSNSVRGSAPVCNEPQDKWVQPIGDSLSPQKDKKDVHPSKDQEEKQTDGEMKCETNPVSSDMDVNEQVSEQNGTNSSSSASLSGKTDDFPSDEGIDEYMNEASSECDVSLKVDLPPTEKKYNEEDPKALIVSLPSTDSKEEKSWSKDHELTTDAVPEHAEKCSSDGATAAAEGEAAAAEGASASSGSEEADVYHVKWINFRNKEFPVITQNANGPCPLIAIMNVLLLKGKVQLNKSTELITPNQLMTYVGNSILENAPKAKEVSETIQLNYEQNMQDAMAVIHKLQTGLDVNVRFTGIRDFEYTPECIIFDLLSTSLVHGWLVDPQDQDVVSAVGTCSYNQLVEKIISQRSSEKAELVTEALLAESFLDRTASQLTYHGLCELNSHIKENQICVFFRNNHFSTMYRHQNELFLLVTDQGFLNEKNVVWETLANVEGDGYFVDANFHTYRKPPPPTEPVIPLDVNMSGEEQVDQDYLLAMSLQHEQQMRETEMWNEGQPAPAPSHLSDHEIAARLQAEEDERAALAVQQQYQQQQPRQAQHQRGPPGGAAGGGTPSRCPRERDSGGHRSRDRSREKEKDSCCIL